MSIDATGAQPSSRLPSAPASVVWQGGPATGRYEGCIDGIDWAALSGPHHRPAWWRWLHHKRWQYVGIGSADVFIGVAIVDLGWACTAFAYVFDRHRRELLVDWSQDVPRFMGCVSQQQVQGARAQFRGWNAKLSIAHTAAGMIQLRVATPGLRLHADLSRADEPPWLLAIGPVDGGPAHATQKSSALAVTGHVQVGARHVDLSGAIASVDSSNGLLAHRTAWRWASAHSAQIGFNLQAGYFGAQENALWLNGLLVPLGPARFEFDADRPLAPWAMRTDDGLLDLVFTPEGARQDDRNLGLVASRYVQAVGTFSGLVRASVQDAPLRVDRLLGVTEDHCSRW